MGLDQLRKVRIAYWPLGGTVTGESRTGSIVVNADVADVVAEAFRELFIDGFPLKRAVPIEAFGGSDFDSIEADNTSAFNCRAVTGGTGWSQHAYGQAIDINPIENPYVDRAGKTSHKASLPFLNRRKVAPGVLVEGSDALAAFTSRGWGWGGSWSGVKDYQHVSSNGR